MSRLVSVTITGPNEEWLANHTRELVGRQLVACGNITTKVRSIYRWQGSIEDETEAMVVLHTQIDRLAELIRYTNESHPYDTAQIVAVEVAGVDPDYQRWVIEQTAEAINK